LLVAIEDALNEFPLDELIIVMRPEEVSLPALRNWCPRWPIDSRNLAITEADAKLAV
jgi:hypothetical protein